MFFVFFFVMLVSESVSELGEDGSLLGEVLVGLLLGLGPELLLDLLGVEVLEGTHLTVSLKGVDHLLQGRKKRMKKRNS